MGVSDPTGGRVPKATIMTMSITVNVVSSGVTVVSVRGEIDHSTARQLKDRLHEIVVGSRPSQVNVDLGLVTFLDSAAVGVLVAAQRDAAAEGARLVINQASPFVHRQLTIAGVSELLGVGA
jgi:anti-anti-sigma factor